jgi:hypothetical protein
MSVKAASPGPIFWVLSGILCACTLAALLVTAIQVKNRKMAARYGERIEEPAAPDGHLREIVLRRGESARVEHLRLDFPKTSETLEVRDSQDHLLVRFTQLRRGQERGWQELRLKLIDVQPNELRVAPEFRPGSPCFGPGDYVSLRPGLRVEFADGRGATLTAWDPSKPEARLKVESGGRAEESALTEDETRRALGLTMSLHRGELSLSD